MSRVACKPVGTSAVVVMLVCASGCSPRVSASSEDSSEPRAIAGGAFEASGVAHIPGSNSLLFVDDGRTREIFVLELTSTGDQIGQVTAIPLGADVTDLEGITSDGRHFYVVGSQSKRTGFDGDGLVRFQFDTTARRVTGVERIQGLKAWLAANVTELRGTERRLGDEVLNIEAIAWDPARERLLLGLRAPVVDGQALVVPLKVADPSAPFSSDNLRIDGAAIRLDLAGSGIRSLEYDSQASAFRVITGSGVNDENQDFRLVEWDGVSAAPTREIAIHPRRLKPEGITRAVLGGRSVSVIVFDTGRFLVMN